MCARTRIVARLRHPVRTLQRSHHCLPQPDACCCKTARDRCPEPHSIKLLRIRGTVSPATMPDYAGLSILFNNSRHRIADCRVCMRTRGDAVHSYLLWRQHTTQLDNYVPMHARPARIATFANMLESFEFGSARAQTINNKEFSSSQSTIISDFSRLGDMIGASGPYYTNHACLNLRLSPCVGTRSCTIVIQVTHP